MILTSFLRSTLYTNLAYTVLYIADQQLYGVDKHHTLLGGLTYFCTVCSITADNRCPVFSDKYWMTLLDTDKCSSAIVTSVVQCLCETDRFSTMFCDTDKCSTVFCNTEKFSTMFGDTDKCSIVW